MNVTTKTYVTFTPGEGERIDADFVFTAAQMVAFGETSLPASNRVRLDYVTPEKLVFVGTAKESVESLGKQDET